MKVLLKAILIAGLPFGAAVTAAQAQGFDPRQPCSVILGNADDATLQSVGAWTFGYLAAKQSDPRPVSQENINVILRNLNNTCIKDGTRSLLELVSGDPKTSTDAAGSEAQARALLMAFFEPDADLVALTAAILPTEAEVHMVYKDPLASSMAASYVTMMKPGIKFGPKPDQDALLLIYTTTAKLKSGDAVLREFPGGIRMCWSISKPMCRSCGSSL